MIKCKLAGWDSISCGSTRCWPNNSQVLSCEPCNLRVVSFYSNGRVANLWTELWTVSCELSCELWTVSQSSVCDLQYAPACILFLVHKLEKCSKITNINSLYKFESNREVYRNKCEWIERICKLLKQKPITEAVLKTLKNSQENIHGGLLLVKSSFSTILLK